MNFVKSLRTLAILLIGVLYGSNAVGSPNVGYQVERDLAFINHSSAGFGISLPTTRANPTPLVKLPDLSQTLSDQAQVSSATSAAGGAVFSTIGDIAQGRQQDAAARAQNAQRRLDANPNDPQAQADLAQANRDATYWREGGTGKTILHGAGGLILGGPRGASGAIANEQLLPTLIAGSKQMYPDPVPTGNKAADDKAWEEVNAQRADYLKTGSLVIGVATGGTSGGSVAQTATQSNYLSHNPLNSRQSQLAAFSEQLSRCKSTPGCDVDAVYAYWSGVSREQQGQAQNAVVADFGSLGQLTPGVVGALGVNPSQFCASGDTRCYNFITANNGQAFSIIATANVLDGYGPSYSSGSVRPTGTGVATTNVRPGSGSGEIIGDLNANGSVTIRPASGAGLPAVASSPVQAVQPIGTSVNGTVIGLNGNTVPFITPGSLPSTQQAIVVSTVNNIESGIIPTGPQGIRWGIPFNNREGELPVGVYLEYRLPPSPGQSGAGTNRIVVDTQTGITYLTWTHYGQSGQPAFVRIK